MKQFLTLAFCLTLAAAAQAINASWTLKGNDVYTPTFFRENSKGATFSLAMTYTLTQLPPNQMNIATIGQWDSGRSGVHALANGGVRVDKTGSGNNNGYSHNTSTLGQKTSIVFTWSYPSETGSPTIAAYINGFKCYELDTGVIAQHLKITVNKSDFWDVHDVTAYDGILTQGQIDYLNTNKTSVLPEPTALALLALGVAGVALRRKVA